MTRTPASFTVLLSSTLRDAAAVIDRSRTGIAVVVDERGCLVDTITDGDIRRAVLAASSLDVPLAVFRERRATGPYREPVVGAADESGEVWCERMRQRQIRQLPIVDAAGVVVDLALIEDFVVDPTPLDVQAVVMAGGFGKRLGSLTTNTPKPMLPVGDRPLLEHIVDQLRDAGVRRVNITTHFRKDVIKDHFADGAGFGVDIAYVDEVEPLGTAGALGLLQAPEEPLLVMNGDILTRVDVREMARFHRAERADITVAVRQYEVVIPFGVVDVDGSRIVQIREKPRQQVLVNAGIYLLQPAAVARVASGVRLDMPDLITAMINDGARVASFPIVEYWLDVGRPDDYAKAQVDVVDLQTEQAKR
jgi:dTDP-glucose pyrophosphorylase